jgi:type III restriction enzyme
LLEKCAADLISRTIAIKRAIKLNKQVYLDPEFKELWDRIKYKTTYSVDFDSEKLIDECCREMQKSLFVSSAKAYIYEGRA